MTNQISPDMLPVVLLADGADIEGRQVEHRGHTWTVLKKNHLGGWNILREEPSEVHQGKLRRIVRKIEPHVLPQDDPEFARLLPIGAPINPASFNREGQITP